MTKRELVEAEIARRLRVLYTVGELSEGRLKVIVSVSMEAYYRGAQDALEAVEFHRQRHEFQREAVE